MNGFEVLHGCFDAALARYPNLVAIGEDVGQIGDVNQGFAGLQAKYGPLRVTDTGIRESTIIGQAIGTALRGLRPIAEIQYLDYLLYACRSSPTTWPACGTAPRAAESADHRPHPRSPAGRHLALGLADGGHASTSSAVCTSACRAT